MLYPTFVRLFTLLTLFVSPSLLGFTYFPQNSFSPNLISQLTFPPTGNRGAPQTTTGGGTRGDDPTCLVGEEGTIPMVAIMPNRENIAKTASLTPVIYVYVPETTATEGELTLTDEKETMEVYHTQFDLTDTKGIIKLKIPAQAMLKAGNTYKWSFAVVCSSQASYKDKAIAGQINVVEIPETMENNLKNSSPIEKAAAYAESALWIETLDTIAQLQPQEKEVWHSLLSSVGLESLVDQPLISCCSSD